MSIVIIEIRSALTIVIKVAGDPRRG